MAYFFSSQHDLFATAMQRRKNYALVPVVMAMMMVVGVIGIVMTVVIVAIVTMVTMAIEIGVLRRPWISWWGGWTILSHGKRNSAQQQGRR